MKYPLEIFFSKIICFFIGHYEIEDKNTIECSRCWETLKIKHREYVESILEKHHLN